MNTIFMEKRRLFKSVPVDLSNAVINNLDEAIYLFNREGRLIFVNKAGEEFIGKTARELFDRHYTKLFSDSNDIIMFIQKTLDEGRLFNGRDIDLEIGRSVNVDLRLYPFYTDNNIEGVIVCIRENLLLTEREDYQADSLLFLLASIAHEIKNPLSGIKGAAQLLKGSKAYEDMREYIDLIIKETNRLNSVLYDYLSVSRRPVFTNVNIHEIIEHALKVMEPNIKDNGILLEKSYDPSLPNINADAGKLLQVFINLIKNAVEAMDKSSLYKKILISTKPASEYMVVYDSGGTGKKQSKPKKQRWMIVSFEDTGRGIPQEELSKIFLPFYTLKEGGSGLGLALSRKIIKDHGGIIRVKGNPGKGAMFNIYLPLL